MKRILFLGAATLGLAAAMQGAPAQADAISDFYEGKRMQMIIGLSAGGGYDRYARLTARYLPKYVPGNPRIISKNKTGGGSIVAANFIYGAAPQDGTYIGAVQRGVPVEPLTKGKASKAQFDPLKFNWLGSTNRETSITLAWHTSGVKTYKDLFEKQLIVAGTGVTTDSVVTAYVMNNLLGMKFKVIAGYPGGSEMDIAMERGEVGGRATFSWSSFKTRRLSWLRDKKVHILYQMAARPNADPLLKDVPFALDFAKDERTRKILFLKFAVGDFGRPFMVGPKVPADRVKALRTAFNMAMKDEGLLKDAKKSRLPINPASGEQVQKLLADMYNSPPEIIEGLRKAALKPEKFDVEIVKIPVITAMGKLTRVRSKGQRLSFKGKSTKGESVKASLRVRGKKVKITVGGKAAKASDLKKGMNCTVTYKGRKPSAISCM